MAKRKRRVRGQVEIQPAQAAAYGINVPKESADRFLSPNDIAKIMNVTGEAVKQWIYHRRLPAVKLANGFWKVRVADLEAFLNVRHEVGMRRVLITDTRTGCMSDVVAAVEKLGHQSVVAHSFADAMLKSMEHYPALFVINLTIKDLDPWKLAEKIRATKALRKYPILFVAETEMTDAEAERALELGAQGFVKLSDTATLAVEIERIMNRMN